MDKLVLDLLPNITQHLRIRDVQSLVCTNKNNSILFKNCLLFKASTFIKKIWKKSVHNRAIIINNEIINGLVQTVWKCDGCNELTILPHLFSFEISHNNFKDDVYDIYCYQCFRNGFIESQKLFNHLPHLRYEGAEFQELTQIVNHEYTSSLVLPILYYCNFYNCRQLSDFQTN